MRVAFLALMVFLASPALAQTGGTQMESATGNWLAFSHSNDDIHTDVCVAMSVDGVVAFRSSSEGVEFRSMDKKWNLTPDTQGDITVKVASASTIFHTSTMGSDTLSALVKQEDVQPLLDAMDKSSSATVLFGTKTTKNVSLNGSTAALNAFRSCSNQAGFASFTGTAGKAATPF